MRSDKSKDHNPCLWFHASSGEFEYAKPLIKKIKDLNPRLRVLVTFSSPSYAENIRKDAHVDISQALPFDLPGPMASFIRQYRPMALLLARSDLWPEMLHQCKAHDVPTILFATSFHQKQNFFSTLWKKLNLSLIDFFFLNNESDIELLKSWGMDGRLSAVGDPRFDQAIYRLSHPKKFSEFRFDNADKKVLIAGSTWPEDEAVILLPTIRLIKDGILNLIIAPHEVDTQHISKIMRQFESHGIPYTLLSQLKTSICYTPILILDQVGFLADFYKFAHVSFIGGSFKRRVHSVMESLVSGVPAIVGPYYRNNPEAIEFQKLLLGPNLAAVSSVADAGQFESQLKEYLNKIDIPSQRLLEKVKKHTGASDRIIRLVNENKIFPIRPEDSWQNLTH